MHRKSARQRVILFLLASGYTVADLVSMTLAQARAIKLPAEIDVYRAEAFNGRKSGLAFIYPNGNPMRLSTYYRLLRETSQKVVGRPMSQDAFRDYIFSSSSKRSVKHVS